MAREARENEITVTVWVSTDNIGSKVERVTFFDREDWDEWDDRERDEAVFDFLTSHSMIDYGWKVQS